MARSLPRHVKVEQSVAFLNFLESNGKLDVGITSTKDALRIVYNEQFKGHWQTQHGGFVTNFSCSLHLLKIQNQIRISKQGKVSLKVKRNVSHVRRSPRSGPVESPIVDESPVGHPVRIAIDQHLINRRNANRSSVPPGAESDLPMGIKKINGAYYCEMCDVTCQSWMNIEAHLKGKKHRVQKLLFGLKTYRYY